MRVLVVDDNEANAYYLRSLLEGHGYSVDVARHGAEALTLARRMPPDVVVSDLLMPVMDGYALLRQWKADERLAAVPFAVYTATYTDARDEKLAMDLGADAFVVKPSEPDDLVARLQSLVARSAAMRRSARRPARAPEVMLREHNEALIRKLEEKSRQLEESNRALTEDLRERERTAQSLRESEERFRQLAENISAAFWVTDTEKSRMVYASPGYERIWGRPAADLYTSPSSWTDAIHPDDRERVWQAALTRQANGSYDEIYRIARPDGRIRWIHDRAFPIRDERGSVYRIVGIAEDVTTMKETEARLAEQAALLDAAHEAILVRDLEDRVVYWNRGAERTYGWPASDAQGRRFSDLLDANPGYQSAWQEVVAKGAWQGEVHMRTRAGRDLVVEGRWTLVRDANGLPTSVLAIDADITERKALEARFLRAQRMESIGTLAGGVAHDLNNVLAPILMSVDLLRPLATDENDVSLLDTVQQSAERGTELVKQVLAFARGVEGKRIAIDVRHIMRDFLKIMRDTFPKAISEQFTAARDLRMVTGDPTQIHQVFMNLCVNARDAMPNGGRIRIAMENVDLDETFSAMHLESQAGAYVVIRISDDGTGMSPDVRERIWDPFFTTKPVGIGTGLGLSTSLAIVRSHGGFMSCESELGKGTTFSVYLPASADASGVPDAGATRLPESPRGHGELVLVVDDESAIRSVAQRALSQHGYRTLGAANGAEATSLFARHKDDIELVLTDLSMPIMHGAALAVALRAMNPRLRIIGCSGLLPPGGLPGEIGWFLQKPYTAATLLAAIDDALRGASEAGG